jgi:hypothetical protein
LGERVGRDGSLAGHLLYRAGDTRIDLADQLSVKSAVELESFENRPSIVRFWIFRAVWKARDEEFDFTCHCDVFREIESGCIVVH